MKKLTLSLAALATVFAASAATYEVNFTNTNQATTPDSVVVEIVNKETKTVKVGEILSLVLTTDAADAEVAESGLSLYPNPVTDVATVEYYNAAAGEVSVMVTGVNGATVATLAQDLPAGKLSFSLSGLAAGSYVVTACSAGAECESTLVVSENANSANPSLSYVSADENEQLQAVSTLKKASLVPMVTMNYVDGDVVNFTAYMGQGMLVKNNMVISANTTVSFPFVGYTSFSAPDSVKFDSVITITGVNFGTDKDLISVSVNGKAQDSVISLTDTEITFAVAKKTFSGNIAVTKDGYSAEGDMVEYIETYTLGAIFNTATNGQYTPYYIKVNKVNGDVYARTASNDLVRFNSDGSFKDTLGSYPWQIHIDLLGNAYIADWKEILYLANSSDVVDTVIDIDDNALVDQIKGIAGDNNGNLYYTMRDDYKIMKYDINTKSITEVYSKTSSTDFYSCAFYNDSVIFTTANEILQVKSDGTGSVSIIVASSEGYQFSNDSGSIEFFDGLGVFFKSSGKLVKIDSSNNNNVVFEDATLRDFSFTENGEIIIGSNDKLQILLVE